jgi:hypothetical protein
MFGTVCPGKKFKFDATGRGAPAGHTVRNPAAVGFVAVTFNATAPTPPVGTPPRPVTVTFTEPPWPIGPIDANCPSTVDDAPAVPRDETAIPVASRQQTRTTRHERRNRLDVLSCVPPSLIPVAPER